MLRLSALISVLVAGTLWIGPYLPRPDLFPDDAAQHVFWLYQLGDAALFPGDPSVAFFSSGAAAPPGYRALYSVLVPLLDAQLAAELVAFALLLLTGWFAWQLGRAVDSEQGDAAALAAVVAVMLLIAEPADLLTPIGLQRTFALPITLGCLVALVQRRYALVGLAWLAAALFYPIVIVVTGLAGAIVLGLELLRTRRLSAGLVVAAIAGVIALVLVVLGSRNPPGIGPTITGAEAAVMPEFGPGGRLMLYEPGWISEWFRGHLIGLGWSPWVLIWIAIAVGIAYLGRGVRFRIPRAAWILLGSGLVVWFVARLTLFLLYLPNRHSRWSVAAFGVAAFAVAGGIALARLPRTRAMTAVVALAAPLIVTAAMLPRAISVWSTPVDRDLERMYAYIATLPKDTLVAAHPDLADYVPLRTRRSVLANTEVVQPFMLGYYATMKPRLEASLRAAYARSWSEMDAALSPYGVDVMLTGPRVWDSPHYHAPFDELVPSGVAAGSLEQFALHRPTGGRVLARYGGYYLVAVHRDNGIPNTTQERSGR